MGAPRYEISLRVFISIECTCLTCKEYFCTVCCVFENDENVLGWKQGRSPAYCEVCFHEKLEKELISGDQTNGQSNSKRRNTSTTEWLKIVP